MKPNGSELGRDVAKGSEPEDEVIAKGSELGTFPLASGAEDGNGKPVSEGEALGNPNGSVPP